MRQFKLINSTGAEFDLMRTDAFLNSPDGLGFQEDNTYANIGISFIETLTTSSQKTVTGEMVFRGYKQYQEFTKFISYKPLKLAYKPLDTWAYLSCTVTRLDKGEIDKSTSMLHCNIDLTGLGKWYIPRRSIAAEDKTGGKVYSYTYDYSYVETVNGEFRITNNGTESCPTIVTIFGYCSNPSWALSQGSNLLVQNKLPVEIAKNHKLVLNSNDNERMIAEYTLDGTFYRNLYQKRDFDHKAFILVPTGDSLLRITDDSGNAINAVLELEEIYETV